MFSFPTLFTAESEKNLTLPPMRSFAYANKISLKGTEDRNGIIKAIEMFANESDENCEKVQTWFDGIVCEGIKELHIRRINLAENEISKLYDDQYVSEIFDECILNKDNRHFIGNKYSGTLKIVSYSIDQIPKDRVVTIYLCKLVDIVPRNVDEPTTMMYPLCVQIFIDKGLVVARGKSKTNLYLHNDEGFSREKLTDIEREASSAISMVSDLLKIKIFSKEYSAHFFKTHLFLLLDDYSKTPLEIIDLMQAKREMINNVINILSKDICKVSEPYDKDVEFDVNNLVEKYFSM